MEAFLYIGAGFALVALGALFLYLITFVRETKTLVANTSTTLNELSARVNDQLRNLDSVARNVTDLTDDIATVVDDVTVIVHEGQKIIVSIMQLEQVIQKSVQEPIVEAVSIFSALGKGIRAVRMKIANSIDGPLGYQLAGFEEGDLESAPPPPRYAEPREPSESPHLVPND